jgi:hypothetical protein
VNQISATRGGPFRHFVNTAGRDRHVAGRRGIRTGRQPIEFPRVNHLNFVARKASRFQDRCDAPVRRRNYPTIVQSDEISRANPVTYRGCCGAYLGPSTRRSPDAVASTASMNARGGW